MSVLPIWAEGDWEHIQATDEANIGYPLKAERQYEDLYEKIKHWTYKGKPTKKAQKLQALERRLDMAVSVCKDHLRI